MPTESHVALEPRLVGPAFAHALALQDWDEVGAVLDPDIDFAALTPRRAWEASGRELTLEVLQQWFPGDRVIQEDMDLDTDAVGDRLRLTYRFRGHQDGAPFVIEQQSYLTVSDGRITWMRLLCSGFRAVEA